jgi:hypothetical protein
MKKNYLFILFLTLSNFSTIACDICGCGVGNYYLGITPQFAKNFVGLRYRNFSYHSHIGMGKMFETKEYFQTAELWARYYIKPKIQLMAFIPYSFNSQTTIDNTLYINGLGDITILANYNLINTTKDTIFHKIHHTLWAGGGVKVQTGKYHYDENNSSQVANPNFQLGTGSTDFLFNLVYTLRYKNIGFTTDLTTKINTSNSREYRFGNRVNGSLSGFYVRRINSKITVMPNAGIYAEYSNFDNNKGYTVANTGGGLLATSLGLETYFFSKIALGCNYQIPITQNLGEGMLKTNDRFMLNVSVLF